MARDPIGLTPEQLAVRSKGIGSSEIAAIAGLNPYRGPIDVYSEKLGLAEPFEGNQFTRWGQRLETTVADAYSDEREVVLSVPGTLVHAQHPIAIATPDRLVHRAAGAAPEKVLEIKTGSARMADQWGDGPDDVPEHYLVQVQWEMLVSGIHLADLAVLLGGSDYRVYEIPYDPGLAEQLVELAERFWRDHVVAQVPPPLDGSDSSSEYLRRRWPRERREMLPPEPADIGLREAILAARAAKEQAEDDEARAISALKSRCADAAGIAGICTWQTRKSGGTDWRAVAEALRPTPDLLAQHVRPGSRVFRLTTKGSP